MKYLGTKQNTKAISKQSDLPTSLSQLAQDTEHQTVTEIEKQTYSSKSSVYWRKW